MSQLLLIRMIKIYYFFVSKTGLYPIEPRDLKTILKEGEN